MNIYYVYAYLRQSDGTPYYIGKGKSRRAWNNHGTIKVPRDPNRIVILESNLTETGAFALERRYIRWYGRKDIGTGILRNMTDGGEGAAGIIPWNLNVSLSEETKQKISQSRLGKKVKPFTEEHKRKIADKSRGRIWSSESKLKLSKSLIGVGLGRIQSEEWINKRKRFGKDHPMFGKPPHNKGITGIRIWITDGTHNKSILKEKQIPAGWKRGRTR
jgi:hypothetical protein